MKASGRKVAVENVNHPGQVRHLDADLYEAMKATFLAVLPSSGPGMTPSEVQNAVLPHLPQDLFPGCARAGWWTTTLQLDLEAKGIIARDKRPPVRLRKV